MDQDLKKLAGLEDYSDALLDDENEFISAVIRETVRKTLERCASPGTLRKVLEDTTVTFGRDVHTGWIDVIAEEIMLAIKKQCENKIIRIASV